MKFLGNTDEVTSCDCCGRTGLKSTVALESEAADGGTVYYGVTCAARALGRTAKEVRSEARDADRAKAAAERAIRDAESRAHDAAWQSFLDELAGTGADVRDGLGVVRFKQIEKLGGFTAARERFAARKVAA